MIVYGSLVYIENCVNMIKELIFEFWLFDVKNTTKLVSNFVYI
jgi:hypothetical protein